MKFLIILLFVPLIRCKSFSPISSRTSSGCSSMTVGGCEPATEELIETYRLPNSESAAERCQSICQLQEGCNYFTYNSQEEKCFLYHYRYLYNCQIRGASATPTLEECSQRMANSWISSCDSFAWENCNYNGNVVLSKTRITDANSCQRLLLIIRSMFRAEYFVYDYSQHTCIFYDASEAQCDAISGPALPNIQDCQNQLFSISGQTPPHDSSGLRCDGVDNGCCTAETPCKEGDGDCDSDNQCEGGLTCGNDNCSWGDGDDCCQNTETGLRCDGVNNGCCTAETPCKEGDGDCDSDNQCEGGLTCGNDNCSWGDGDDCCQNSETGLRCDGVDNGCCTAETPCKEGDGDCDSDNQCEGGLTCGNDNCSWGDGDDCCQNNETGLFSSPVHACMRGLDNEYFADITLEECKEKCNSATSFICKSLDYVGALFYTRAQCYLSEETKKTRPSEYTEPCYDAKNAIYLERRFGG